MTVQVPFWTWWINIARTVSRPFGRPLFTDPAGIRTKSNTQCACVRVCDSLKHCQSSCFTMSVESGYPGLHYCNNSVPKTRTQLLFPDKHRCSFDSCLLGLEREQRYLGEGGFDIKTAKSHAANNIAIPVRRSSELYYIHMSRSIHKGSEDDPLDYMECWWQTGYGIQPCPIWYRNSDFATSKLTTLIFHVHCRHRATPERPAEFLTGQ